jgi:hypothetical protein
MTPVLELLLLGASLVACGQRADAPKAQAGDRPEQSAATGSTGVAGGRAMNDRNDTASTVTGIAPSGREPDMKAEPSVPERSGGQERLTGKIVVTGTEVSTLTTLQREGRRPVRLVGDFEEELQRLSGAVVRVEGTTMERGPGLGLKVHSYEVLSIDGQRPHVGVLLIRDGTLWLAGSDTVRLTQAPQDLQAHAGAKVWIIGRSVGGELQVQSYGIVRMQ